MKDKFGAITGNGADLSFYYSGITGITIGREPATAMSKDKDWNKVNIQVGQHKLSINIKYYNMKHKKKFSKNFSILLICTVWLMVGIQNTYAQYPSRYADCENATIDASSGEMANNGIGFKANYEGNYVMPYLSTIARRGNKSVVMKVNETLPGEQKDRNEYYINGNFPINTTRFTGWSFRIDGSSGYPTNWILLKQFYHLNAEQSPPIALELVPNANKFQLRAVRRGGINTSPVVTITDLNTISTDTWYDVVIQWRVSNQTNGGCYKIWLNGVKIYDVDNATIGYTNMEGGTASDKVGIYRGAQNTKLMVYLDNMRQGNSYEEVDPSATASVSSVSLSPATVSVAVNRSQVLTASVLPVNATNIGINWSSSNNAVATINNRGVVTGISAGTATITATTADGNKTASTSVTVYTPASSIIIDANDNTGVTLIGSWNTIANSGGYNSNILSDGGKSAEELPNVTNPEMKVIYTPTIPTNGYYDVYVVWMGWSNCAWNMPIDVTRSSGTSTVRVNTQRAGSSRYHKIGTVYFNAGTGNSLTIRGGNAFGYLYVDAVEFIPVAASTETLSLNSISGVKANSLDESISVFPNPLSNTDLNLVFRDEAKSVKQVRIIDITGKEIFKKDFNRMNQPLSHYSIKRSLFNKGVFFVTTVSDQGNYSVAKLLVN